MKRKIISTLFALVLACSLSLVTAVPVAAADSDLSEVVFETWSGGGLGNWSLDGPAGFSGSYSVNITGPMIVKVAYGETLQTFADVTQTVVATHTVWDIAWTIYDTDGLYLHAKIYLDTTGNDAADTVLTGGFGATDPSPRAVDGWYDAYMRTGTAWQIEGYDGVDYTNNPTVGGVTYTTSPSSGPTLSTLLADGTSGATWAAATVVHLAYGYVTGSEAYVDDITVDGVVYELEPRVINTDTDECFNTIQDAIDDADTDADDTITVVAGTYTENVAVNKSLTLTGASSATVTVDAADAAVSVFTVTANDVNISGFTATGCTGPYVGDQHAGIYFPAHVENCNIHDNILTGNIVGILMLDTEDTTATGNNTFTSNNASTNLASGIEMQHTYGNTFTNNTANSNVKYGFCLDSARNNTFTGNTANSNTKYGFFLKQGEGAVGSNDNTFTNNTANSNTRSGIRMTNLSGNTTYTGNTFDSNVIAGMELGGTASDNISHLTVNSNSFSGNDIGVKIDTDAIISSVVLRYNNIVGNTSYGASCDAGTGTLNATDNWWGNASGPQPDSAVYTSYGDKVSTLVTYNPWLLEAVTETTPQPPTFDKTLALKDTWTLVSPDKEVTTDSDWVGTEVLADSETETILAYKYEADPSSTDYGYTVVDMATQLTSVDAYYLKTSGGGGVGVNYSTAAPGVVTKTLSAGWNVISCAGETDAYVLLSQLHYVQIGEQEGTGLTSLVGQGGYNQFTNSISETLVTDAEWAAIGVTLNAFDGYWVYMNAGKSFGVIPD